MVGSVLVHGDRIIGEGFTSPFGGPHAEVNAIAAVKVPDMPLLPDSILYVSLEPCSHFGKTPPCADHIISKGIRNVVVGVLDPNEKVAGKGIQKLRDAGCAVTLGVLEKECREHHKRFLTFHLKKRPYIILKWAETPDGFMAPEKEKRNQKQEPYWISNTYSRQLVHQWRSMEQGILVGTNTVLEDNPKLDVRLWTGKSPVRILIDKDLKIGGNYHVLDTTTPTIVLTRVSDAARYRSGIQYEVIDFSKEITEQICTVLFRQQILSVIVEGGAKTLQAFIDSGLWDEARVFTGGGFFGKGLRSPRFSGLIKYKRHIHSDTLTVCTHD